MGEREVLFRRNYEPLYETLADSTDRTRSIACPCKAFSLVLHLLRCALTPFMPLRTESDRETNSLLRGGLGCRNGLLLQNNTGLPLAQHQGKMANKGGSLQNLSAYESNMKHKLCGICLRFNSEVEFQTSCGKLLCFPSSGLCGVKQRLISDSAMKT